MSEDLPKGMPAPEPVKAAEAPASVAAEATPAANLAPTAMDDAAKAMSTALPGENAGVVAFVPAPAAAPGTESTATTSPTIGSMPPAPLDVPPPAANTSGMHLQYVAPGVKRQSMMATMKWQLLIVGASMGFAALILFRGSGIDNDVGGVGGESTPTKTTNAVTTAPTPPDETAYMPPPNRIPTADFTVNAGAIGDPAPLPHGKDAGVNKGGYADERKALEAAEAMIATNPDKALAMVDQHDKDYPRGIMDPDARMIRIEAFQKKGDDAKALQLGNEFLEDYPHSGPASHVQEIVEALKKKDGIGQ